MNSPFVLYIYMLLADNGKKSFQNRGQNDNINGQITLSDRTSQIEFALTDVYMVWYPLIKDSTRIPETSMEVRIMTAGRYPYAVLCVLLQLRSAS